MDNQRKNAITDSILHDKLRLGLYRNKGRVAIIQSDSHLLMALKSDPNASKESKDAYELLSWLIDTPRTIGENKQKFILSTLSRESLSGFDFHPNHGLFIDSFNSPHEWRNGELRAQNQIADLLLPSGQWHRHYDTVVLSESANDKQVELVRHWLALTGGSLIIIKDKQKTPSDPIQQLINEVNPIDSLIVAKSNGIHYGSQQTVDLPSSSINALRLTDKWLKNSAYFSIIINNHNNEPILALHDIQLAPSPSWQALAHKVETSVNQDLIQHNLSPITVRYKNNTLKICGNEYIFSQFQLKQERLGQKIQILPILVAENRHTKPNQLELGIITGDLPKNTEILEYRIAEHPKFGKVELNQETKEWQYQSDDDVFKIEMDQFDLLAVMDDGRLSAPISIQLQTGRPPQSSIPGKRTFSVPDPIYHEPAHRNYAIPDDMQIHHIQLAQTHLQRLDDKNMSLTANRWALLKLDITSPSSAKSPNLVAIISDKDRNILGKIRLTGPDNLPTELVAIPNIPNVLARNEHQNCFTAPLKGEWMQPGIQLIVLANNKPIITSETNQYGFFSPNITLDSHITAYVDSNTLYQQGHGIYAYSPLSWGLEAAAKLPIKQLTLYSYPATTHSPSLFPYIHHSAYTRYSALVHPQYDAPQKIGYHPDSQIDWAYFKSQRYIHNFEYHYTSIEAFLPSGINNPLLGLASSHVGGGINESTTLWHEIFGHGFGLPHTTALNKDKRQNYPYNPASHGENYAYDQYRQQYMTYKYTDHNGHAKQMYPAMFPIKSVFFSNENDAFLPHADYYNTEIHQFLSKKIRWQPNRIKGEDNEDGGFAGEGFYQQWDNDNKDWVTLNQDNFLDYSSQRQINQLPHQRDVPVYSIRGQYTEIGHGQPHPYNYITVDRAIGHLPAEYHNLETGMGCRFYAHNSYALTVTYASSTGLTTEILQIHASPNSINLNIADKGELVKFTIHTLSPQKEFGQVVYQYMNPDSLANRVFASSDGQSVPSKLLLDNYWQGSKVFWAATDKALIDFSTGTINASNITPQSALCARWVENGKLHQQYFSLSDPFGQQSFVDTGAKWVPINHLNTQASIHHVPSTDIHQSSNQLFLSDVHISQQIDIRRLGLPAENYTYWAVLVVEDENGNQQEKTPIEPWYLSGDSKTLHIKGTIDSTPDLKLAGIKIYIDKHLHDDVLASSIWLHQNTAGQLVENKEFLNYDRPVVFNSIANQPEVISSLSEERHELPLAHAPRQNISVSALNTPLIAI